MKADQPSTTATGLALSRAVHQVLDRPVVFPDAVAARILGPGTAEAILAAPRKHGGRFARALRAFAVARSRVVEDALREAVNGGVRQYVILGAGLDTFAYRNPYPQLRVFEVDRPGTQAFKRERLRSSDIAVPQGLTFVPLDFETGTLSDALAAAGVDLREPVFFSWLGVTMYLEPRTVIDTLAGIAALAAPGSRVIFDYMVPLAQLPLPRRLLLRLVKYRLARLGEPWKAFFDPRLLVAALESVGFGPVSDLGPGELNALYFAAREDGLKVGGAGHVMCAHLGAQAGATGASDQ